MIHIVYAKTSEDPVDNYIKFYKEKGKVWIGIGSMEEREFTTEEVQGIIKELQECINE